jgi:hypothetical protein
LLSPYPNYHPIRTLCQEKKTEKKKKTQIFFTRGVDNGNMGQKTNEGRFKQSIIFEKWMADAIKGIAEDKGLTFTAVVLELLRQELAFMGYSIGIGREGSAGEPSGKRGAG